MKKRITSVLLMVVLAVMLCTPAMAAEVTVSGFYDIGTVNNVTITPMTATGTAAALNADIDADGTDETIYPDSIKMNVTYTAATTDAYYGVLLVEGDALPTKENAIFYIDQVTAESNSISFSVYPILPTATADLSLYISSSVEGASLIKVPLSYAKNATYEETTTPDEPEYTLGDPTDDGIYDAEDALMAVQIGLSIYTPTAAEALAANVSGDSITDAEDALMIIQYGLGIIDSWN